MARAKITKKKKKIIVPHAVLNVCARPNNTILSLAQLNGDVLCQVSCGTLGFKHCRKSTPHATQTAIKTILGKATDLFFVKKLDIVIRSNGIGRESVLTQLQGNHQIEIGSIEDLTNLAYGGVRWRRNRRV